MYIASSIAAKGERPNNEREMEREEERAMQLAVFWSRLPSLDLAPVPEEK